MAGSDPWINWNWLKIGPFTPTEEDRVAADRRRKELEAQENVGGLGSLQYRPRADNPLQNAVDSASGVANALGDARKAADTYPENFKDWTLMDRLRAPFSSEGEDAYRRARGMPVEPVSDENTPVETIVPEEQGDGAGTMPQSDITRRAAADNAGTAGFPIMPEQPVDQQPVVQQPAVDPQQQMIEDLKRQKALIDQIYPQRPVDNASYQQSDEYAMAEKERAKHLANLAFFSAITQGAGGQWEGFGRGLAAAGQVYSKGFDRYQEALTTKAKRVADSRQQQYEDDSARSDAAVKLYGAEQDRKKGMVSEARLALKERQNDIDEYFKERLKLSKGDEFNPANPEDTERLLREWRVSRDRGEITTLSDVKDK